jgi:hypothetical protein
MARQKQIPKFFDLTIRIVSAALLLAILVHRSGDVRSSVIQRDSIAYWATGRLIVHGENPYDVDAVAMLEKEQGYSGKPLVLRTPPWSLVMILPLGLFTASWASMLWFAVLIGALVGSVHMCLRIFSVPSASRSASQVILYTFAPVLACLYLGQMGLLMLFGLVVFLRFHSERPFLAGAALLLPLAKPHVSSLFWIALLLWVVAQKKQAIGVGCVSALTAATLIGVVVDPTVFRDYSSTLQSESIGQLFIPALSGVLRLLFFRTAFCVQFVPMLLGLVWFSRFWAVNRSRWNWHDHGLTTLVVSILVTPYAWMSDEVILLPAMLQAAAFFYKRNFVSRWTTWIVVGMFVSLNALLLGLLIARVPFATGVYFWSSLVWFAWYVYGRRQLRWSAA